MYEPALDHIRQHPVHLEEQEASSAPLQPRVTVFKMRYLTLILGIIAAFIRLVSASGDTAEAWLLATQNQSSLFGYQLVGSMYFNTTQVCNNISVASHGLWVGTEGSYIQSRMPHILCPWYRKVCC